MEDVLKRYEELFNRIDKSDEWLDRNNYTDWEQVKLEDPKVYQLRHNLILQIESIQKALHNKLNLQFGD